jgi:hypothetical protein
MFINKDDDSGDYLKPNKGLKGKVRVEKVKFTWPPTLPSVGSFDDLENDDSQMVLEVGESCFSGLRATFINLLERNYNFRVSHAFELGRKEERLVNGQKDGRRGQYTIGTHLNWKNFKIQLSKSGMQRGEIFVDYSNGNAFNSSLHVGLSPLKTDADFSFNFGLQDMNIETKFANYNKSDKYPKTKISKPEPTFSIAFTQPAIENVAIGTQISFVPYADKAQLKVIGRHTDVIANSKATLGFTTGTMANDKFKATYSQELTKNVNVVAATELTYVPQTGIRAANDYEWKSISKLGYSLNGAGVVVTGVVDTDSSVNMVMNTYMGPDFVITLSANCNYYKKKYDAGFGIQFPL